MKNNSCVFFGAVLVMAWLQSRDSDDAQNPVGGQDVRGSCGKGRGKSVLQLQRHDYEMKMETENQYICGALTVGAQSASTNTSGQPKGVFRSVLNQQPTISMPLLPFIVTGTFYCFLIDLLR